MAIINVTTETFEKEVLSCEKTVLLDFWSPTCPPCKMLSPILDELAPEIEDKVQICKVNSTENRDLVKEYKIMGVPTLMVFEKGQLVKTEVGFREKDAILEMLGL